MEVIYGNLSQSFVSDLGRIQKKNIYVQAESNNPVLSNSFTRSDKQLNSCVRCNVFTELCCANEAEQWYVRHNYFIVLYHRLHVSTYIQVVFRSSFTGKSIKCYICWDPIMLTEVNITEVNMMGSQHVQHFMDLLVKEDLKMICIQVQTCSL